MYNRLTLKYNSVSYMLDETGDYDIMDIAELKFCNEVEQMALKCGSYIEAVLLVCENIEIEPAVAAKLLSLPLIEKIQAEGINFNLLPKKSELPV